MPLGSSWLYILFHILNSIKRAVWATAEVSGEEWGIISAEIGEMLNTSPKIPKMYEEKRSFVSVT